MKLEQLVSDSCKVMSTLYSDDVIEQHIFLILPDIVNDEEKVSAVTKVTNILVQNGWAIADIQTFSHSITVDYTKNCRSTDVMTAMWSCQ